MKQCFYTWTFCFVSICYCSHNICKIQRFTFDIVFRIICFHDLIQTCSAHFHKFLCLNCGKLCTGAFYIQCGVIFYRSIATACKNIGRVASISI